MNTKSEIMENISTVEKPTTPAAEERQSSRRALQKAKKPGKSRRAAEASVKTRTGARPQPVSKAPSVRAGSKSAKILELIKRASGATLVQIGKATGWQPHSIRGFLSTATKKHRVKIASSKNDAGQRVYRAAN